MPERRRAWPAAALIAVAAVPLALALTDPHLGDASAALTISTATAAVAVSVIVLQPLMAGTGRVRRHRVLGVVVLVHVGALFVESPADARFALSPDGPTRARMALLATIALIALVAVGALRGRLPLAPSSWRLVHAYLAVVVIALGLGHALLTDGALDGLGTAVLLAFGAAGLLGIAGAHVARTRRR